VPGLGTSFGRGAATSFQEDLQNSDCILIMGSNMAEAHPVGFRFPMKAREKGATLIHVDPHFSRTSAMCQQYVPIRTGSDIVFLGALINHVLQNDRWFHEYVLAFTNASTILNEDYRDAEDLDGMFCGFNPETRKYDPPPACWKYEREANGGDPTLQHPRCVMNVLRRHYSRYTPELVERTCGCTKQEFLRVAETLCANSGRERTSAIVYAVGWTQHSTGVQMIRAAGILQLLLGNIGRPGGGIMAMRGHASIQGSTDVPTLYDLLPGYIPQPAIIKAHGSLNEFLRTEEVKHGYWANLNKFVISLLKAWYGDAARPENDYGFNWIPRLDGNYSHLAQFIRMAEGRVKGLFLFGQNPAAGAPNAGLHRYAMKQLDWLVVRDWFEIESACFWYKGPEGPDSSTIGTEVFFLPAASSPEKDGTFTNTQRLLQWHDKAIDPPDDCRSDTAFLVDLGKRMKRLYAGSTAPRDQGLLNLTWDYDYDEPPILPDGRRSRLADEPDVEKVLKEINGYTMADRRQVKGFSELKADGSTACGCWIYSGVFPEQHHNRARDRKRTPGLYTSPKWGFAWPHNRRMMYNRASADPEGRPWSERKKYIWWDEGKQRWTGVDEPDFEPDKPPSYRPPEGSTGMASIAGDAPFIMKPDGRGWLFAPAGTKDGPLPTHYEPIETILRNPLYRVQSNPTMELYDAPMNPKAPPLDSEYPIVATTYRVTEHYLSGPMSRFNSWLNELQPEMFIELSPELARERGIRHGEYMVVWNVRGKIEARAMVTKRIRPLRIEGQIVHQIGVPLHWGFAGETLGGMANDLTAIVTDPNVSMHEGKVFQCQVAPGRVQEHRDLPLPAGPRPTNKPFPATPKPEQPEGQAI
jgi:formate dehydrogenase major subunit